ncbi:heterokaryon incompatibility protein-domain-containing protein [Hypoxylon trugodes]|uniref:heterokaryon incompatibility protein-domain-containing protein n=1 Tax=Hypoxylon trugodes TaxID=326681 RepID=UPI00219F54E6|nr:heterokaryon incompatibility protein-domain-containing protein [Hypoxylon trugodes]KAI1387211.1 heterokaryon incompatibility protein-domain-containing protein [Hypoxylon trugodes]
MSSRNRVAEVKPNPGQLCPQCQELNLLPDKFRPGAGDDTKGNLPGFLNANFDAVGLESRHLGYLEIYRRRDSCCFCWLIFEATHSKDSAQIGCDGLAGNGERVDCNLEWRLDGRDLETDGRSAGNSKSPGHPSSRRILISNPQRLFPDAYIMPLSSETSIQQFSARRIPFSRVDLDLIRYWMDTCSKKHGESCRILPKQVKGTDISGLLRYIDLKEQRLVHASDLLTKDQNAITYATLSYVWGAQKPQLTLSKSNFAKFCSGGLGPDRKDMPATIRDAMIIVQEIGIRYIWVDALCIIQDSMEDWAAIAPLMDAIFSNGTVNICAASGNTSASGISGSPLTSRSASQAIADVCGMQLAVVKSVESRIRDTIWNIRAWTFQERILSPRSIIFVDDRVFFQCSGATWSEDVYSDITARTWTLEMVESPMQNFSNNPVRLFADLVELYTPRKLTVISDKLIAFEGIASVLSSPLAATMVYGLPNSYFDWALLWENKEAGKRVTNVRPGYLFPSWSWCGWEGGAMWRLSTVASTLIDLHDWLSNHSWITWYYGDEGRLKLVRESSTQDLQARSRWSGYDFSSEDPYGRNRQLLASEFGIDASKPTLPTTEPVNGCLHFCSYTAHFQLSRRSMSTPTFESKLEKGLRRFGIVDSQGDWCGTIILNEEWSSSVGGIFEFVAVSEARDFSMEELDTWNYYVAEERHIAEWYIYYALLITRNENTMVAERVGLAKIYKNAFRDASFDPGTKWTEIILG